jgi:hypothetical protein
MHRLRTQTRRADRYVGLAWRVAELTRQALVLMTEETGPHRSSCKNIRELGRSCTWQAASRIFEVAALIRPDPRPTICHLAHRHPINRPAPLVGLAGQTATRRPLRISPGAGALHAATDWCLTPSWIT